MGKSRVYRYAMVAARVTALSFVGLSLLLYGCQGRMIYFPTQEIEATPADARLEYEDVTLKPAEGAEIHGWWVPRDKARGTVLFCHGNAGNISHRIDSIRDFNHLGLSVFIFDYRGYGRSTGRPNEKRIYEDVEAAWRHLVEDRGIPPDRIVIFGRSLGGGPAAYIAARTEPAALILESTFTSLVDVGRHYYPYLPVGLLLRTRYSVAEYVREVKCPLLVAHSPDDDIIPYKLGRGVYEAAEGQKDWFEMRGTHNEGFITMGAAYPRGMDEFLTRCLGPAERP